MAKILFGLLMVMVLMATTLDQDRTLTWLDSWLVVSAITAPPVLKLPEAAQLSPLTKPSEIRSWHARASGKHDTQLDHLAGLYKNQLKVVDGKYAIVQLRAKNGVPDALHYRLPRTNILGGEVQGDVGRKSATVSVHWPRKD